MTFDLDAIKARCEAAVLGPWEPDDSEIYAAQSREWIAESLLSGAGYAQGVRNAAFIAHARTDVPALVDEVERLRAELSATERRAVAAEAATERLGQMLKAELAEKTRPHRTVGGGW